MHVGSEQHSETVAYHYWMVMGAAVLQYFTTAASKFKWSLFVDGAKIIDVLNS